MSPLSVWKRIGWLLALLAGLSGSPVLSQSYAPPTPAAGADGVVTGRVVDEHGAILVGALVRDEHGRILGRTGADGELTLIGCPWPCRVTVESAGYLPRQVSWRLGVRVTLASTVRPLNESVTVTAYKTPMGSLGNPVSTRVLTGREIREASAVTLDGQLRLVPGVETFRRSSSLVANPSSQGLSLRGLGSTSASRTLVTEDDVPLNDAFSGTIHWEEQPELSLTGVELVRGGGGELYGSSAIGGVVSIQQARPSADAVEWKSSYGSENTYEQSALLTGRDGRYGALATGGALGTDGFIQEAPEFRGPVDIDSNVHAQNGLVLIERDSARNGEGPLKIFARTSALNEARQNGTPIQQNGTRIWRYSLGADWNAGGPDAGAWRQKYGGTATLRLYGSTEHYRQTFSTINALRTSEVLNQFAKTPDNELGAAAHWSQPLGTGLVAVAGADVHDVRAHVDAFSFSSRTGVYTGMTDIRDRQRQTGIYGELLWVRNQWTMSGAARVDWFSNFDGYQYRPLPNLGPLPTDSERVFDPRLGLSRKLGQHLALSATGFRGYRAPTPNELYRSTQVGDLLTNPNNALKSERATGWETAVTTEWAWGTARTGYFWTQVNRPITAATIDAESTPIQLIRENLGQIESRGISSDVQVSPARWLTLTGGYQYADATVTKSFQIADGSDATGSLAAVGNWIPQVARNMGTLQVRGFTKSLGVFSIQGKMSGKQYDDDANTYLLHGYFKLDAFAMRDFGSRLQVFTAGENLLNRAIEVGKTPTTTLGMPRVARVGFRVRLGRQGHK